MDLDLTEEQRALKSDLRRYFRALMTPETRDRVASATFEPNAPYRDLIRHIGRDGWLAVDWAVEHGGRGYTAIERLVVADEADAAGCPIPFDIIDTVGPTIAAFGRDEQCRELLPRIAAGELHLAIGSTEADACTDLSAIRTTAIPDGDDWIIDGSELYTALAHQADLIWLAARTVDDEGADGITVFLVPTDDPGFGVEAILTLGSRHTAITRFHGVRVPASAVVGEVNGGTALIAHQLGLERVVRSSAGGLRRVVDEVTEWCRVARLPDGSRPADQQWVRIELAACRNRVEVLELLNLEVAAGAAGAEVDRAGAAGARVWAIETDRFVSRALAAVVGSASGQATATPPELDERSGNLWSAGLRGGAIERHRDVIASAGLGLPVDLEAG